MEAVNTHMYMYKMYSVCSQSGATYMYVVAYTAEMKERVVEQSM